ncbi:hypothetical protein AAE02nite_35140 [Adhaeribacter aerolatus]|uniref:Uncharacterized protein n=1 Tax=Adhaeribacter aerolatus TaxID=670289 RepID=A0A512B1L6_9BACT|nr:hypothetical protein [Adhaeribacter aerolatus]GEO05850.1 hypothetical protein AAE02nite_35140 [Adhaeribacter aerolatus]
MEKTEKKEEKKKSGKKKVASKDAPLTLSLEKIEREFNKKMKGVVKEVKKDTKKAIKNIIKEARQKLKDSAALIMKDLLKNAEPKPENITTPETEQPVVEAEPIDNALDYNNQPTPPEAPGKEENEAALAPAPPKTTNSRVRKTRATTGAESGATNPTRTRKPTAPKANPADMSDTERE